VTLFLIQILLLASRLLVLLVIVQAILSFILDPYHPIRETLDRLVEPLLRPIRQVMPSTGMLDFSPLVFIILVSLVTSLLVQFLSAF
jgi:YggT family protein